MIRSYHGHCITDISASRRDAMRLDLPIQTAIDRRLPYRLKIVTLGETDETDPPTVFKGVRGVFCADPHDPAPVLDVNPRGWHCQPPSACTWTGPV
jgi:hypothetical protein